MAEKRKKKWEKPKLIVLVKGRSADTDVLCTCKGYSGGPSSGGGYDACFSNSPCNQCAEFVSS